MPMPQSEPEHKDLVDVLVQSVQNIEEIPQADGTSQKSLVIDPKSLYYKTLIVPSSTLARLVLEIESLRNLATQCFSFMAKERAEDFSRQILGLVKTYLYSLDSKSGESMRENGSSQGTLMDKIARNKIERSYMVKGEKRRSMIDAMLGKDKEEDMERD
jgi:hypothetical protein